MPDTPNEVTFGPIFRKEFFHTINTVNLFLTHDVGTAYASGQAAISAIAGRRASRSERRLSPAFRPTDSRASFPEFNSGWPQDNRIGPQLFGTISNIGPGTLKWNGGILFGIRPWAPLTTWRWQAEYEIHF